MTAPPSFTCPRCGRTAYHVEDVRHGYCGACHAFTGEGVRFTRPPIRTSGGIVSEPEVLANCAPDCDWLQTRQHASGCQALGPG